MYEAISSGSTHTPKEAFPGSAPKCPIRWLSVYPGGWSGDGGEQKGTIAVTMKSGTDEVGIRTGVPATVEGIAIVQVSHRTSAMADALSVLDGGFSADPSDGSDVRTGYAVAVHPERERVFKRSRDQQRSSRIHRASERRPFIARSSSRWVARPLRPVASTWTFPP